jgi:hypothetical protein
MAFLLLTTVILLLVVAVGSVRSGIRRWRSPETGPKERRTLGLLLALGILGGGYLSVGLVYASAKTRWFGAPMPVVIFQPGGDKWMDFPSPLTPVAPFYNLIVWLALAFAPVTLPRWWRQSGRA